MEPWKPRPAEVYGNVRLSVQASEHNYCDPRISGIPFENYRSYEIALMPTFPDGNTKWLKPSEIGMDPKYDEYFAGDDVAGYVDKHIVEEFRTFLKFRMSLNIEQISVKDLRVPGLGAEPNRKPAWSKKK